MKKKLKEKIKKWIINLLKEEEDWYPKKVERLDCVRFSSSTPLGKDKNIQYTFTGVEWQNGEGIDFQIDSYNEGSHKEKTTHLTLHHDEIDGIMAVLDHFKFFEE